MATRCNIFMRFTALVYLVVPITMYNYNTSYKYKLTPSDVTDEYEEGETVPQPGLSGPPGIAGLTYSTLLAAPKNCHKPVFLFACHCYQHHIYIFSNQLSFVLETTINNPQPPLTTLNHAQPPSTTINNP